jgi:hypothetical protein
MKNHRLIASKEQQTTMCFPGGVAQTIAWAQAPMRIAPCPDRFIFCRSLESVTCIRSWAPCFAFLASRVGTPARSLSLRRLDRFFSSPLRQYSVGTFNTDHGTIRATVREVFASPLPLPLKAHSSVAQRSSLNSSLADTGILADNAAVCLCVFTFAL